MIFEFFVFEEKRKPRNNGLNQSFKYKLAQFIINH